MDTNRIQRITACIKNDKIQKYLILIVTLILSFCIVFNGAMPKKYKLNLGDISEYDITAPREVENAVKTKENRELAYKNELPDMKEDKVTSIEIVSNIDEFLTIIKNERSSKKPNLQKVMQELEQYNLLLVSDIDVKFLLLGINNDDFNTFEHNEKQIIAETMKEDITVENLEQFVLQAQMKIQALDMPTELKNIGSLIVKNILKPNRIINEEATEKRREIAYNDPKNVEMVEKGQRILSVGDVVTYDKLQLLQDLNMLETQDKIDYELMIGILIVLSLLTVLFPNY